MNHSYWQNVCTYSFVCIYTFPTNYFWYYKSYEEHNKHNFEWVSFVFLFFFQWRSKLIITPIPVAALCQAWVGGRSPAGIAGSNHAAAMDICLLWVLCVVR
jgi:hypothetical protein